jgi:uncharacterized repeat protein (TIGR03803 family)
MDSLTLDGAGNLYGPTPTGGVGLACMDGWGCGTISELSRNGSEGWDETILYNFCSAPNCTDGQFPQGTLIFDKTGNLYGTTERGGANGSGVIFELSPVGASWTETVLYSFCSQTDCTDGGYPANGVIMDSAGNFYGTTTFSGVGQGYGFVFELRPSGSGWTEQVISDATVYQSGLTMDAAGNIYGVGFGGWPSQANVFELSPNGEGGWNQTVWIYIAGSSGPYSYVGSNLLLDKAGNIYGVQYQVNKVGVSSVTVYKLSPGEQGKWTEKNLYTIPVNHGDQYDSLPPIGLILNAAGDIYGASGYGGAISCGRHVGCGTVFEVVAPVGKGSYQGKVLWNFNGPDGALPSSVPILDSAGNLYGTTSTGGSSYFYGVVFEVTGLQAATTTTLSSSPNPSTYGQAVTFSAVVTSSAGSPPDGEIVTFVNGSAVLGTGSLSDGSTSLTILTPKLGTTAVTALYAGDSNFSGSTSNTVNQVVNKGTHQGPYGVAFPAALNFGQVPVGQTSPQKLVSLTNTGNSQLTVSGISISGDFALPINQCADGVKSGTHCNVYVTYTPHALETDTGTLTFTDNASNSPQTILLTGTGASAASEMTWLTVGGRASSGQGTAKELWSAP